MHKTHRTDRADRTVALFQNGLNCSQAMMVAFGDLFGLDEDMAIRLGRPFGAGLGRLAQTCGAITGAIMVLGLAQEKAGDEGETKAQVYGAVQELAGRFEKRHGTTVCRDLLGADFRTPAGTKKIQEEHLVQKRCPQFVQDAAEILERILEGAT